PGEYEVHEVLVTGVGSFHDEDKGSARGRNTVFAIRLDDLVICHLGDLGHALPAADLEKLGDVDIALVPISGPDTNLSAARAAEVVHQLEPKVVVPMSYDPDEMKKDTTPYMRLLHELGVKELVPVPKLSVTRSALPDNLQVVALGWITMGVIGLSLWVFGGRDMNMAVRISALATAAYVLAFWSGNFQARAVFGVIMLGVIYFWWWFVVSPGFKDGFASYDDVKLMIAFGLTTLVLGSTIGVIVQVILGTGNSIPSSTDLVGAHASAQTGGYLVLVSAGFIEWQLRGGGRRTNLGLTQIALLFAGGFILAFSLLLAQQLGP